MTLTNNLLPIADAFATAQEALHAAKVVIRANRTNQEIYRKPPSAIVMPNFAYNTLNAIVTLLLNHK